MEESVSSYLKKHNQEKELNQQDFLDLIKKILYTKQYSKSLKVLEY